jgi:hypothetical protein
VKATGRFVAMKEIVPHAHQDRHKTLREILIQSIPIATNLYTLTSSITPEDDHPVRDCMVDHPPRREDLQRPP